MGSRISEVMDCLMRYVTRRQQLDTMIEKNVPDFVIERQRWLIVKMRRRISELPDDLLESIYQKLKLVVMAEGILIRSYRERCEGCKYYWYNISSQRALNEEEIRRQLEGKLQFNIYGEIVGAVDDEAEKDYRARVRRCPKELDMIRNDVPPEICEFYEPMERDGR